ncbi:acetylglutamate kinase [Thermotoga sp. Ku-13t]|uniref:acetylglutamate kinase n=1 Tax=Thermotoga sp. Ku-13t TaxID=1755813 RepID=UPI001F49CE98|nr:acetylglutamate kinase [Thermotoga sp. Ku-13t]
MKTIDVSARLSGKVLVVKVGGNVLSNDVSKSAFVKDIAFLTQLGIRPLIVHGGGPEITAMMEKLGMKPIFKQGYRVTDEETLKIVEMVLNKTNKDLVSALNIAGVMAVGLCGKDANFMIAEKDTTYGDIGYVGKVKRVNDKIIQLLFESDYVPVIAPIGVGEDGTAYNLNADVAAAQVAIALSAEMVIFMTDIEGVVKDGHVIPQLNVDEALKLIKDGTVKSGMVPKLQYAIEAVKGCVKSAHIINGKDPHSLLIKLFVSERIGTTITRD